MAAKSTTIRSLAVAFTARTKNFTKGIKRMMRKLKKFRNAIGGVVKSIARIGVGIAAGFAAGAAAIFAVTNRVTQMGDKFAKASKATGIMVEDLSGLGFAAERSGSSIDAVLKSIGVFAKNASMASDGLATYTREFDKLGVSITNEKGELKDIKDLFLETGDAIAQLQSNTQRLGTAKTLFGRGGAELLPLFLEGEKGIQKLIDRAKELGVVWTGTQARISEVFQDTLTDMKSAFSGLVRQVVFVVAPKIIKAMKFVTAFIVQNRDTIVDAWKTATDFIVKGINKVIDVIDKWAKSGAIDSIFNTLIIGFHFVFFDLPKLAVGAFDVMGKAFDLLIVKFKRGLAQFSFDFINTIIQLQTNLANNLENLPQAAKTFFGITKGQLDSMRDANDLLEARTFHENVLVGLNKKNNELAKDSETILGKNLSDSIDELKKLGNALLDFSENQIGKNLIGGGLRDAILAAVKTARGIIADITNTVSKGGDGKKPPPTPKVKPITERPGALERGSIAAFSAGVARPLFRAMEKPLATVAKNTTKGLTVARQQLNKLNQLVAGQAETVGIL